MDVTRTAPHWRNWGLNQSCEPYEIVSPATAERAAEAVSAAVRAGRHVRAAWQPIGAAPTR